MQNGLSTGAAGAARPDDTAAGACGPVPMAATARSPDSGEAKESRAILSVEHRVKDELLFVMLFVVAVASLLPSVLCWY